MQVREIRSARREGEKKKRDGEANLSLINKSTETRAQGESTPEGQSASALSRPEEAKFGMTKWVAVPPCKRLGLCRPPFSVRLWARRIL
jgi:hypothetical protein